MKVQRFLLSRQVGGVELLISGVDCTFRSASLTGQAKDNDGPVRDYSEAQTYAISDRAL